MRIVEVPKLFLSIAACELAGQIGSLITLRSLTTWYAGLKKPSFTPPAGYFGPIWSILYALMGVSLFLVWRDSSPDRDAKKQALSFFGAQLVLNSLWSLIFFGLKSPLLALVDLVSLWFAILLMALRFFKISRPAGLLLLPYLFWTGFAGVLNYSIWKLNRR